MLCPICKEKLDKALFNGVEIDYCSVCLGMFFDGEELRQAKDARDHNLRWLDFDLWKDANKLKISRRKPLKFCPKCRIPLFKTNYGDSNIKVDICRLCKGVWLDRGEFKKIINYLKEKASWELARNYAARLREEAWEVFVGPEIFKDEVIDFLVLLKLLIYKFPERE